MWRAEAATRTLYAFDVRTPAEYAAGHIPGMKNVPGGQLVQETDRHAATWGGRVVLVDDDGVRAIMTAHWMMPEAYHCPSMFMMIHNVYCKGPIHPGGVMSGQRSAPPKLGTGSPTPTMSRFSITATLSAGGCSANQVEP